MVIRWRIFSFPVIEPWIFPIRLMKYSICKRGKIQRNGLDFETEGELLRSGLSAQENTAVFILTAHPISVGTGKQSIGRSVSIYLMVYLLRYSNNVTLPWRVFHCSLHLRVDLLDQKFVWCSLPAKLILFPIFRVTLSLRNAPETVCTNSARRVNTAKYTVFTQINALADLNGLPRI